MSIKTLFSLSGNNNLYQIHVKDNENIFVCKDNTLRKFRYINNKWRIDKHLKIKKVERFIHEDDEKITFVSTDDNLYRYSNGNFTVLLANISCSYFSSFFITYNMLSETRYIINYDNPNKLNYLYVDIINEQSTVFGHFCYYVKNENLTKYNLETRTIEKEVKIPDGKNTYRMESSEKYFFIQFFEKVHQYCSTTLELINVIPNNTYPYFVNDKFLISKQIKTISLYHFENKCSYDIFSLKNGMIQDISENVLNYQIICLKNHKIYCLVQCQLKHYVISIDLYPIFQLWVLLQKCCRHRLFDINVLRIILNYVKFF